MKIAWLIQGDERWGIRSGSKALISALRQRNVDCPVIALGDGDFTEECKSLGLEVIELQMGPIPMFGGGMGSKLIRFAQMARKELEVRRPLAAALKALNADALHFRRPNIVKIAGHAAFSNRIPAFWHIPNAISATYPFDLNRRLYQSRCNQFGIVPLANSKYTATTLGSDPVEPRVMYLAVDPDRFDPAKTQPASRRSLGIGEGATVFGVIARLHPSKGQDRAIRATMELVRDGHDLHLLIIGGPVDGAFFEDVSNLARQSEFPDRIHITGPVSDTERYYRLMDVSLNCRIDPEPCGISVLESMMCETPALVHASGGPSETVVDGQTGWHYHGPEAADIRDGMLRAIGDQEVWPEIGRKARDHAIKNFSLDAQASQYLQIVRETLDYRTPDR